MKSIPVLDLACFYNPDERKKFVCNLRQVCKNIGFFYVSNHGVPIQLQHQFIQNTQLFFDLSEEEKQKINMKLGGSAWRGYFKLGEEYTSGKIDLKQGLYLGQELDQKHPLVQSKTPLHGSNLFPENPQGLKGNILDWLEQMSKLGKTILQAISESLYLDKDAFSSSICKNHLGLLRLFHYPEDKNEDPSLWGVGQHTDYGLITILLITDKGLQAKNRQNQWVSIDPIPNTFVINLGDILERITDGLYKSTPHRAKNTQGKSRYSIPYFYDPDWNAEIKMLQLKVSQDEQKIQKQAKQYKRWDNVDISYLKGTYGKYLIRKVSKVFPQLAESNL